MAGRHQSQYARYTTAPSNQSYPSTGGSSNNLTVPFQTQSTNTPYHNQTSPYHNQPSAHSPFTNTTSPSYHQHNHSSNAPHAKYNSNNATAHLRKYTLQPPFRKLPLSKTMPALGYPDMFPQRPGQVEDILTEANVRHGFIDKAIVSNEHTCAHDIVYGKLQDDHKLLDELGSFMVNVLQRQSKAGYITGPSSFKPPARTTLIDSKREQWMQELASGITPLRKLARNVPHGFKGEKLLETLAAKQVPFSRATWYIKLVGLSEMSQRNASNAASSLGPQPIQWTLTVTTHLKKQLNDLLPPQSQPASTAPSPHSNSSNLGRGNAYSKNHHEHDNRTKVWTTPENRTRFEQRWSYSVKLTRWQYFEGLLDQRTFLKWSLDSLAASSTHEIMWLILTGIIRDYVDEYKRNRTLTKLLIEALIKSYSALMQTMNHNESITSETKMKSRLKRDIETLLQSLFVSTPDMFVIPRLYQQHRKLFDKLLGQEAGMKLYTILPDVCRVMREYWLMVKARNEVFCENLGGEIQCQSKRTLQEIKLQKLGAEAADKPISSDSELGALPLEEKTIYVLDVIAHDIDSLIGLRIDGSDSWIVTSGYSLITATKLIFGNRTTRLQSQTINKIVSVMCRWATKESKYNDWKVYLITSILIHWRDASQSRCIKDMLQNAFIQFLDDDTVARSESVAEDGFSGEAKNAPILFLYDVLTRSQLFSYQKYLLRLIARGDLEPKHRKDPRIQQCIQYLSTLPIQSPAPPYVINQRRVALYGTKNDIIDTAETKTLNDLKRLTILAITGQEPNDVGYLFGSDAKEMTHPTPTDTAQSYYLSFNDDVMQQIELNLSCASRYMILQFISDWLLANVKKFVVKNVQIGEDNWRVMTSPGSSLLNTRQFVTIVRILEYAQDYSSIIDFALWTLEKTNDSTLYPYILDCFRTYSVYWKLMLNGRKIANAVWQKHSSLATRNMQERSIMMYIIQLIQEGYTMEENATLQLKQDLQIKAPKRGRYNTNISIREEILQLSKNPASEKVQLASETLSIPSRKAAGWLGEIIQEVGSILHMTFKEKQLSESIRNIYDNQVHQQYGQFLPAPLLDFHRQIRAFALVVRNIADKTTFTGQADDIIINWFQTSEISLENMNQPFSWIPLFIALLVSHNVVNLKAILQQLVLPWFEQAAREIQQNYDAEENRLFTFCQNLIDIIRLLVVQTRNYTNEEQQQQQRQQQQEIAGTPIIMLWQLRVEEFFRLQHYRQFQLACDLNHIEPMFGLLERLVMIATNLPLSSRLLQSLVILRADLLQICWFRQACLRDLNGVYQRFAAHEAEATTEKRMKKKMLAIVEELIGENYIASTNNYVNHQSNLIASETSPDFLEKLQRVFMNVGQWNEAQCRVQMNLLLDNISLSDGQNQNPNNPHILSDETSLMGITMEGSASSATAPSFNKDLQSFVYFFYDVVLSEESNTISADNSNSNPTLAVSRESNSGGSQRRFQFLKNLIHELREPVLNELLNYGCRMLEGDPNQLFPTNITLLLQEATEFSESSQFDSEKFSYRCNAFFKIFQRMLAASHIWTIDRKIEFVKSIFAQINRYKSASAIFIVMQKANACYADAVLALTNAKNDVDVALTLLLTDGISAASCGEEATGYSRLSLEDIRTSLFMRLRLVVPFASLIWEHPRENECNILEWIRALMTLLGNPVIHGNGSQEQFFEFTLDFVSLLIDEVPKELKKASLQLLNSMHSDFTSIPIMFHSRVKRIMPFLTHNMYLASTKLSSSILGIASTNNPQQQQQHLETCLEQSKPWEWLEDYVGDPPHDNDAPINLALFNAKKIKNTDSSTYTRWFKYGFNCQQLPNTDERVGHIVTQETEKIKHQKPPLSTSSVEDEVNGDPYVKQEDNSCNNFDTTNVTLTNHEDINSLTKNATSEIPQKRKVEMEEGELP
ncbi:hypothetical protein BDF20DRAFT_870542 [Mycotypha africana]|uniref:uncharacterized protein n=1 Tax=Mycotypha africana TaxID=64632 RepID=UPI0023005D30|nr:uncharacterized protein BDF20DRAFT_870542 [Mycotypha africana]KAI8979595.1 hypothetical protein BDF20DRAFT_870542 [Mycotypha africana]